MNIVIIGPAHPLRGGLATFDQRLAHALQDQGHKVMICSFSLQYPSFLFPGTSQFTDEPAPEGLDIRSWINSVNPLNWIRVGNRLKNMRPDLVIVRYWLPFMGPALGTILRRVRANRHTRILCIADNINPHEKRPGDKQFTAYFMKPVDAFVTMSRQVLSDLQQLSSKPAAFSPHPLYDNFGPGVSKEEACRRLGLDAQQRYLLFFGFIRRYKGLDLLLEAMADPRIRDMGLKLLVAGEFYEDRAPYDALIERLGLQDQLQLCTDFVPNSEVRYYFSAADLVVQPYKNATQSGITQVAYHFEKPMVVTNVGGLAEHVPDGKVGLVTEPRPEAIADAIVRFYEQPIEGLARQLQEQKKLYSWETFIKALMDTAFGT